MTKLFMYSIINSIGREVKIFAKTFEQKAYNRMERLANLEPCLASNTRIMPDAHAGKGCTVGTTMTISNHIKN